ncbi:metallophosphoesterase [Solimicrobium silvestre]|uniref:Calcineurin-like phosphoesterase n=1 Tax=Solimicrobium silvestre TaxID=2099400 RepID=A0A2S9GT49_9BURK|nr:metallophosphoesterase [Solimicrobium silvestre]PRC90902.1 Calcineurin-like phosphoesterase [Solimicrobium silvestre]
MLESAISSTIAMAISTFPILLFLSACSTVSLTKSTNAAQVQADAAQIQAAWVVIGEQGQAVARVITRAAVCPVMQQDDTELPMQVRAASGTVAQRTTLSSTADSKPSEFPVLTCEAQLKSGVISASVAGKPLPVPKPVPLKILVVGDSGCRMKLADNAFQSCNDVDKWAFSTVAKTAAGFAPDLVIHVGDYQYRENPCPAGNATCAGSPWGFGWDTWQADFFTPAAPLLAAAPWVMARGNHESCARAGQGWWRFMDPRALQQGRDCNVENDDMQGDYSAPYAVPLGAGAQLIVFDSSKTSAKPLAKTDSAYSIYSAQFKAVDHLAEQAEFSIFLEHHPILGFAPEKKNTSGVEVKPGNLALQSVLQDQHPQRLFAPNVQLLLAGHVHLFEAITFDTDHPMQLVSGNGGSSPDVDLPAKLSPQATPFVNAKVAHFNSTSQSGFMTMERASVTATDWVVKAWDKNGVLMTTCSVSKLKKECS